MTWYTLVEQTDRVHNTLPFPVQNICAKGISAQTSSTLVHPRPTYSHLPNSPTRYLFYFTKPSPQPIMAQTKTTKKRKVSPDLTESDIDDVPTKRKATARKSTGGVPVGRRLPTGGSAGPSTRRTSGPQSAWGGGSRGGGDGVGESYAYEVAYGY